MLFFFPPWCAYNLSEDTDEYSVILEYDMNVENFFQILVAVL